MCEKIKLVESLVFNKANISIGFDLAMVFLKTYCLYFDFKVPFHISHRHTTLFQNVITHEFRSHLGSSRLSTTSSVFFQSLTYDQFG